MPMTEAVGYELVDGVAVLTMDDGKANAISHAMLDQLGAALDRAEGEARSLVLAGRDGRFSAGFDLKVMTGSPEGTQGLVTAGARFLTRLYGFDRPTVAACTGHALAAGALLLLACDTRIGAEGPAKIGLNEVAIGMALPVFAVELARERLTPAELGAATMQARIYDPTTAVAAGYLDRVVPPDSVVAAAVDEASRLGELRGGAYARTKAMLRGPAIDRILGTLEADMATLGS